MVSDVMRPIDQFKMVTADTLVSDVLETMGRDDVNQLPVGVRCRSLTNQD